jgi:hypothetical protein
MVSHRGPAGFVRAMDARAKQTLLTLPRDPRAVREGRVADGVPVDPRVSTRPMPAATRAARAARAACAWASTARRATRSLTVADGCTLTLATSDLVVTFAPTGVGPVAAITSPMRTRPSAA